MVIKRSYDNFHLIDGVPMLTPDIDVEITYEDLESSDSGFDQGGFYHRIVMKFNRRKWKFKYAILTKDEFVYLRALLKGKQSFLFSFQNEQEKTETVMAISNPVTVAFQSKRSGLYKNLTIEIVEC